MEAYMRASKAWYADYDEWQEAQKTPAYVVHTPWKCPSPPPLPEDQGTFVGSIANGFHIEARDETGPTSIYLTNLDVPSEALSYLEYFLTQWQSVDPNTFEDKILYATQSLNEIRPQTADQQRADHEFLGQILKGLIEVARQPPPQLIHETTDATGLGIARSNDTKLPRTYPANVHHLSFAADIGIQNAIRATGDKTRFISNPSYGTAVARDNPSSPVWWEIDATAEADRWHEAATSDDDRNTFINDVVAAQTNLLSRDSGITNLYILQRLLQTDGELEIGIGEIQNLRGKTKRTPQEKEALTYEIKQALELWGSAKLRGTRKWKTEKGKWETVVFEDSFWHCTSVYPHGQLTLPGFYGPPKGFVIVDSTVTKIYRKHPAILHAIGNLDPFIELLQETGKVAADWALSMGWASVHYGRANAGTRSDTIKLKRKTLLTTYKPHTEAQNFIDANRPARMTDYWDQAVKKLKRHKIWANIDEPPKPNDPQGWGQKWLEQTVTITLGGDYQLHAQAVHRAKTKAITENKKRTQRKKKNA